MKYLPIYLFLVCMACNAPKSAVSVTETTVREEVNPVLKPKNVVLLIGDGMGLSQITAGNYFNGNKTALEGFPVIGIHKCHASNKLVTDSAAGATAFACGEKTYNGAIGVRADSTPVQTILEELEDLGYSTGLIATSTIVHATPASFIAHNEYRKNYEDIALDFLDTEVDYFVGGGKKFFDRREDERNLIEELEARDYTVETYLTDFKDCNIPDTGNFAYFSADKDPLPYDQGRDYLLDASKAGLSFLDNHGENGLFLMIEGSQIDWGGHANIPSYVLTEFYEFDLVIQEVLDWAKKDGETLVVVTADHETGGLSIRENSTMDSLDIEFISTHHTATMIPVFAYGPGSELFAGIYENTAIYDKMRKALQLK